MGKLWEGDMAWRRKATQGQERRNMAEGTGQEKGQVKQRVTRKVAKLFQDCPLFFSQGGLT